jgi:hypothetical protein
LNELTTPQRRGSASSYLAVIHIPQLVGIPLLCIDGAIGAVGWEFVVRTSLGHRAAAALPTRIWPGCGGGHAKPLRDPRIDFCRGVVLTLIFIDHIPSNVLAGFTLQNLGFCDATEIFVLISGISAAIAYGRLLDGDGMPALMCATLKRILRLYVVHLLLLASCLGVLYAASQFSGAPGYATNPVWRTAPEFSVAGLARLATLRVQPNYHDILPLYMLLMLWLPLLLALARHSAKLVLGVSLSAWAVTQPALLATPLSFDGWYFNPMSWQLLFAIGVVVGLNIEDDRRIIRKPVFGACIAFLTFALLAEAPWAQLPWFASWRVVPETWLAGMNKSTLSIWRIVDVVAMAYVFRCLVGRDASWLRGQFAGAFSLLGRHGLLVFASATFLDHLALIWRIEGGRGIAYQVLANAIGLTCLWLIAWVANRKSTSQRRSVAASATWPNARRQPSPQVVHERSVSMLY